MTSRSIQQMDLHHPLLISENIKEMSCVLMEKPKNSHEECEGSAWTHKNLFALPTVMQDDWDLLTETRNNVKILKIKKGDISYEFDQKVSKNAN